jgi:biopolymer transport protein ExbB/TolQ
LALGVLGTAAFYVLMYQPALKGSILRHYTTEHPVEFVIVALFIWGLADIALKLLSFPKELLALRRSWLPPRRGRESTATVAGLLEQVRSQPKWALDSAIGRRLVEILEYIADKGAAQDLRDHVQYLLERDEEATQSGYTLLRFVIGICPILGFLGTVVHFGTALGGVSLADMSARLPMVVSEMGQAFNTTTVALAASMTTMFALFVCERLESRTLRAINRLTDRELLNRFEVQDASVTPFLAVVKSANDEALKTISQTLDRQIGVWTSSLGEVFERFDERQRQESEAWRSALDVLQQRHEGYDVQREDRLRQLLALIESRQDKFMAHILAALERAASLRDDFTELLQSLHSIARGEGRLAELQTSLAENLRVLRETQQLDGAMQGLADEARPRPYVAMRREQRRAA